MFYSVFVITWKSSNVQIHSHDDRRTAFLSYVYSFLLNNCIAYSQIIIGKYIIHTMACATSPWLLIPSQKNMLNPKL